MDVMIHTRSFRRGIQAMPDQFNFFKPKYWFFYFHKTKGSWLHLWTPVWHKGRGPYITFGCKYIRIIRGY